MARLIPRKQIEEQQNISGSLSIRENVFVVLFLYLKVFSLEVLQVLKMKLPVLYF